MIVRKIQLKNFRNYENLDIELNKKINVFLGNNGQGKTNILESIYVLAITNHIEQIKIPISLEQVQKYKDKRYYKEKRKSK